MNNRFLILSFTVITLGFLLSACSFKNEPVSTNPTIAPTSSDDQVLLDLENTTDTNIDQEFTKLDQELPL